MPGTQLVPALGATIHRRRIHGVAGRTQARRDTLPDPATLIGPVHQNECCHCQRILYFWCRQLKADGAGGLLIKLRIAPQPPDHRLDIGCRRTKLLEMPLVHSETRRGDKRQRSHRTASRRSPAVPGRGLAGAWWRMPRLAPMSAGARAKVSRLHRRVRPAIRSRRRMVGRRSASITASRPACSRCTVPAPDRRSR